MNQLYYRKLNLKSGRLAVQDGKISNNGPSYC